MPRDSISRIAGFLRDKAAQLEEKIVRKARQIREINEAAQRAQEARSAHFQGRNDRALEQFAAVLELDPGHSESVSSLYEILAEEPAMAPKLTPVLDRLPADHAHTLLLRALVAYCTACTESKAAARSAALKSSFEAATASLKAAEAGLTRTLLGKIWYRKRRHKSAARELLVGIETTPVDAEAHAMLGASLLRQGQPYDALTHLQIASMLDPTLPEVKLLEAAQRSAHNV
ncbi:MAG: hypothetical protein AB1714_13360 [Acidobacteriota bacterium]